MNTFDWIVLALVIIGALNWGVVALANYDLIGSIFGSADTVGARIVYGLVGLASLYLIILAFTKINECSYHLLKSDIDLMAGGPKNIR